MLRKFLDVGQVFLDDRFPLPRDRPFTRQEAAEAGLWCRDLARLCRENYLHRLLEGVYVARPFENSLALRAEALRLVVPPDAVVTDRTAGWLHGASMILAPGDHLAVPPVSMFVNRPGARLRNDLTASGQRCLPVEEIAEIHGLQVTSAIRTACDLGRLLSRDGAFAALDSMLRLGVFGREELVARTERYRGMRGVRQLRAFAPLADGRAESPGESALRLRWLDVGNLPRPELQIEVSRPGREPYRVDVGVAELLLGFEYDGEEWHLRTPAQQRHDRERRGWMRDQRGWMIEPVTKHNLWGPKRDIEGILLSAFEEARRRF